MTERVCNQVPDALMRKIAEAANSWCALREIERQYGDKAGLGADMRSAEMRMRAAMCDLPDPPTYRMEWDARENRSEPFVESAAEEIYNSWRANRSGWVPWVGSGNSFIQDEARAHARQKLRSDGYTGGA